MPSGPRRPHRRGPDAPLLAAARAGRAVIETGRLGTLVTAEAIFATSSVRVREPANHLFDPARSAGGILAWLGIHDLDTLPWLIGEPVVEVSAMTARRGDPELAVEDVAVVALRFAGGAVRPSRTRTRCPPAAIGRASRSAAWTRRWSWVPGRRSRS